MLHLVAQTLLLAVEEGEEAEGGLEFLLPETPELIGGIIAFAIVFFFMWRWAFPAINRALEARQQAVAGQLEEAEKAKGEAQSLLDDYRQQLADARNEANRIIEEARETAESMRQDIVAKANAEAEEIKVRARDEVRAERERARDAIRDEMATLSIDLAERVVQKSLDRDAQRTLVEQYLSELERMSS